jgi:hypothetical protein
MADKKSKILQAYGADKPKPKSKKTTATGKRGSKLGDKVAGSKESEPTYEPLSPEVDEQFAEEESKIDPGSAHLPQPEDAAEEEVKQISPSVSFMM